MAKIHEDLAEAIYRHFGQRIDEATAGTAVPPELLAGLIGNECGRSGLVFNESQSRLEPHVLKALTQVRDGARRAYNRTITREDLAGASDDALKALARSYGATQVMGWHTIDTFPGATIQQLRDPKEHLKFAVRLLLMDSKADIRAKEYGRVLRRWNTGSPNGTTYHPNYVPQGKAVIEAYKRLTAHATPEWAGGPAAAIIPVIGEPDAAPARPDDYEPAAAATADPPAVAPEPAVTAAAADAAAMTQTVTNGSGSWIRSVLAWMAAVWATASGYTERVLGMPPEILKIVLYATIALGVTYLILKAVAEWQVRGIAADPAKQNVK